MVVADRRRLQATIAVVLVAVFISMAACSSDKPSATSEADLAATALAKGLAAHKAGNLAEAASDYQEALRHDPNNKFAYYNLGLIDQTNGALGSADSNYSLAISIDPKYGPALYNLAIVKTAEGDTAAAIDLYRTTIEVQPDYAAAHLNLGFALIDSGDRREGRNELSKAVELDPSLASRIPDQAPSTDSASPTG